MTDWTAFLVRCCLVIWIPVLIVVSIPWAVYAESRIETVIDGMRNRFMIEDDNYLDAMVSCILKNDAEALIESSFQERTGLKLDELATSLEVLRDRSRSAPSPDRGDDPSVAAEPILWLRDGSYVHYTWRNAFRLGLTPYTNPSALDAVATGYVVPVDAMLSDANVKAREELLDRLLVGRIAATQHTSSGAYIRVGPGHSYWPDLLKSIRGWDTGSPEDHSLGVNLPSRATNHKELGFLFLDRDEKLQGTPVIAWNAGATVHDLIGMDYYTALVESVEGIVGDLDCIPGSAR